MSLIRRVGFLRNVMGFSLEPFKRTLLSTITILVSSLIIAGVVIFSLIQLLRQFETFVLQNYNNGETILTLLYGLLVVVGLLSLYLIFSTSRKRREPELPKYIPTKPVEAIVGGFMDGFVEGLQRIQKGA